MSSSKKPVSRFALLSPPLLVWTESFTLRAFKKGYRYFPDVVLRVWWPVLIPPILLLYLWFDDLGQGPQGELSVKQWLLSVFMGLFFMALNFSRLNTTTVHLRKDGVYVIDLGNIKFYPYEDITDYRIESKDWGKTLVLSLAQKRDAVIAIDPKVSAEKIEQMLSDHVTRVGQTDSV
jgi:hypothetical protein